jgi:hypothetical protein
LPIHSKTVLACVRSTARPHDDVAAVGGEGAIMERGAASEGRDSSASAERTESVQASNAGSHCQAGGDSDKGSSMRSYYFGPSMLTISHIKEMIDHGYFAEGAACVPGEETVLDLNVDEDVVFEEFFTADFRMPLHPVLSDILLKFPVQCHQLTPTPLGYYEEVRTSLSAKENDH